MLKSQISEMPYTRAIHFLITLFTRTDQKVSDLIFFSFKLGQDRDALLNLGMYA